MSDTARHTKIICIEGSDGSGKETQTRKLLEQLKLDGYTAKSISFPQYDNMSSIFVKEYLNGSFGLDPMDINPYVSSLFFTADRLISYLNDWKNDVDDPTLDFLILDRYVGSNLLHQGSKIKTSDALHTYINWEQTYEFSKLLLPKPDMVIFLDMPRWASKLLCKDRKNKITGGDKQDIHECNEKYLEKVQRISRLICTYCEWNRISCVNKSLSDGAIGDKADILSPAHIHRELYKLIKSKFMINNN